MGRGRLFLSCALLSILCLSLGTHPARAQNLYGGIRGIITDQSGAFLPDVTVTATNLATGVASTTVSTKDGTYEFLQLQIGDYTLKAERTGFAGFTSTRIHLDLNQVYVQDIKLPIGAVTEEITVESNPVQVEMNTPQLGAVVNSAAIEDLPLINRNWVNLQQTEPGVVAASDSRGEFATNGSQSQQNSFLINGQDTNDLPLNTRLIVPSPDAISEFRMVTNTINPEYGRNSGAVINALIKSGSNEFHGDAFEFYRDSFLNARGYFTPAAIFHQNEFGGTVGGPIWKKHAFFFFSYQGIRERAPEAGTASDVPVFTTAERGGNFGQGADIDPATGKPFVAESSVLAPIALFSDSSPGAPCPVSGGVKCAANSTPYSALFSSGVIPTQNFDSVANALMTKYVPQVSGTDYLFNPITTLTSNQYLFRIDENLTSKDLLWGTWFQENRPSVDTIPFTGATLPGFAENAQRHFKLLTLSWTHTLNDHMLNEFRAGYTRFNFVAVNPVTPTLPSSAGFNITPQDKAGAGLPVINITGLFSLGFSSNGPQPRIDQTYQAGDSFSMAQGRHTFKFGFEGRKFLVYNPFYGSNDGVYTFNGAGEFSTTNPGADFLLGIPDSYSQGSGGIVNAFSYELYSYAQDQFRLRPNFTLSYGIGWTVDLPIHDNYYSDHAMVAFVPGQQSQVFTNAPIGYVFQGDPGVHPAGTNHTWRYFGPRFGFAWSPNLGWLSGGPGKLSIRGGYGIYYNRSEEELTLQFMGMPPFTLNSVGAGSLAFGSQTGSPGFANPFADVAGRGSVSNPFPFGGAVARNVDFSPFLPLWQYCCATQSPANVDPVAENFNLTIERQLSPTMKMSLGYVGAVAHHLSIGTPLNIPTPFSNVADCVNTPGCDSFSFGGMFPQDFMVNPNIYGPIDQIANIGNSNYNAFQATLDKRFSNGLQFFATYTWSHSLDDGSGFENSAFGGSGFGALGAARAIDPYCIKCDYGNSSFDAQHRFVASVLYQIPGVHGSGALSKLANGWNIAALPTFQSGFPLDVIDSGYQSFMCQPAYSDFACPDVPNVVGSVKIYNPRTTLTASGNHLWFSGKGAPDANSFAPEAPGTIGNAGRDLFRGPGINNWDLELFKNTHFTERTYVQLRIEMYNAFNHTQFSPNSISTNIESSRFGQVRSAYDPRRIQLAAKFYF
ncbi:MAG TPA: carboxypeptidase regulatory-like domain-containing protein [Candidatus Acidoferrum sp.]|nr:carboxypeptidase regulatory-like domain-containing protein [Candidatus Acidoferrum sp.]